MLTTNVDTLASFKSLRREITGGARIFADDGSISKTLLPNETLASIKIENNVPGGKFFGFAVSQKMTITLIEKLSLEAGTKIQPYIQTKNATEIAEMPYFFIDTVEINDVKKTTTITAYDSVYFASKRTMDTVTTTFPLTLQDYATNVVTSLGCSIVADFTGVNPELTEATVNLTGTETVASVLTAIAEMTGTICVSSSGNKIVFKELDTTPLDTVEPGTYFNFTSQDAITLTKVVSATQLGENYISGTEEGYAQTIWDNPFLDLRDDVPTLLDALHAKVNGLVMIPYTLESRGNPFYEIGDCLSVLTGLGEKLIYYFNETLTYSGGLKSKTTWQGDNSEEVKANPTSIGEALKSTSAKVDKIKNEVVIVASKAGANEEAISALKLNTDSISASVSKVEQTTAEAIDVINGDINTLTEKVEATMTEEDVQIKIQSELANGVDKVTTSTGFTFNEKGLTVSKTGSEMTTTIDEDGMSVYRDNSEVLTADNQGVIAYNLHAKTYLLIGSHSRIEDWTNTSGEARTGCFWIGG